MESHQILLALLLNESISVWLKKIVQSLTYAPYSISTVVLVSMQSLFLSPSTGVINKVIEFFGGTGYDFMGSASAFRSVYVISGIWHINLPGIIPTAVTVFILNCGSIMSVGFEKVYLMQNSMNQTTSEIIATYVYKMGILHTQYSYTTAIGLFNSLIVVASLPPLIMYPFVQKFFVKGVMIGSVKG